MSEPTALRAVKMASRAVRHVTEFCMMAMGVLWFCFCTFSSLAFSGEGNS